MLEAQFAPIDHWPGSRTRRRLRAKFATVNYNDLERELRHLGARKIIVQAFITYDDIRNDGWPRSSARFKDPGIILSFTTRGGEFVSFPCDTYTDWRHNLRAITLTLTALRAIDRYGVTRNSEQYQGWKRLPAPIVEEKRGAEWAFEHLARLSRTSVAALRNNSAAIELAYRSAAKQAHPDAGGSHEAFTLLQDCMRIIHDSFRGAAL